MFERESRLYRLMYGYLQDLVKDVDDEQLAIPIQEDGNCPAWILAHLALGNDYALRYLGERRVASAEWHKRFRPGAKPGEDDQPLPSKSELVEVLEAGHQSVLDAAKNADAAKMDEPHNFDLFKDAPVQTVGDMVAHLMTTHLASHLGQISAWRRQQGKPALF